jgi:pyridoxamine 5'-phosphate oxidase
MREFKLQKIRRSYKLNELSKSSVDEDPFTQFNKWFEEVIDAKITDPSAMVLSSVDHARKPSSRIILLKEVDDKGFIFFTNYLSRKADDFAENPAASILLYWKELERQVRIEGTVEKTKRKISEDYFQTRPRDSQIGTWVSKQSTVIANRRFLDDKYSELEKKFGDDEIPLPEYWGGYRLIPNYFEFWQGREKRLHDRICYKNEKHGWNIFRLAP